MEEGQCFLCTRSTNQLCPNCRKVHFCRDEHLYYHRRDDYCFPFKVVYQNGKGKSLVATRDINHSDLIMRDQAIVTCPYTKSKAQCLQCHRRVSGQYKCPRCGFPMCDAKCSSGDLHKTECKILEEEDFEADIEDVEIKDDHYACIMPLRCLSLRESDPDCWELFSGFRGHCDEQLQQNVGMWNYHQEHAVTFIRETLELGEKFTAAEIMETINIMYVNSVNMEMGPGRGEVTGFYPVYANMNHDCHCNTNTVKLPDHRLEVRSVRRIREGEEITTQYVSPEKTTRTRRQMLYRKWFFWCTCSRCRDPTEHGSFLSAFLCPEQGCGSPIVPHNPLDEESDYRCLDCGHCFSYKYAEMLLRNAERDLKNQSPTLDLIQHLELFLFDKGSVFHPHHHVMINIKQKLGNMYGNCDPYSFKQMTIPMLQRKIQVCCDVLNALDNVQKGVSKWRLSMDNEINKAKIFLNLKMIQHK